MLHHKVHQVVHWHLVNADELLFRQEAVFADNCRVVVIIAYTNNCFSIEAMIAADAEYIVEIIKILFMQVEQIVSCRFVAVIRSNRDIQFLNGCGKRLQGYLLNLWRYPKVLKVLLE